MLILITLIAALVLHDTVRWRRVQHREARLQLEAELARRRIDVLTRATISAMRAVVREDGRRRRGGIS
ncbi:hypothetical protein [Geodermatophilus sp. SYSU D01119]